MPTVAEWRKRKFLSQQELANQAGVSKTTIAMIELGRSQPHGKTARNIAKALGVEPTEIDWPEPPATG